MGIVSALVIHTAGAVDDWTLLRWTDGEGNPLLLEPPNTDTTVVAPPAPFGVAYPVPLEGVGCVYLWAGSFAARTASILLERELANRYIKSAGAVIKQYGRRGAPMADAEMRLQTAQQYFSSEQWQQSLAAGVQAAEQSVVSVAQARLQRMHGRTAFLWGACADDPKVAQQMIPQLSPPLNLIQIPIDGCHEAWQSISQQAQGARMAIAVVFDSQCDDAFAVDALRDALTRLRGQARYWSVAMRLHQMEPKNGTLNRIRERCELARAVDFGTVRLLHGVHCLYRPQHAYSMLNACVQHEMPFEGVHLEWYWYDGTLYDLDMLLERYGELGKPIHLTLGLPPSAGYERFSRAEPLEWVEGAALIALSKPYVAALRIPSQASKPSAGACKSSGAPSEHWERITQVIAWSRAMLE
ncbi:MAG: hypothetical protein KatS3mg019_0586 [Fimbriimonadales bacterium]|nr:MAG: hypothetical protein KatS3mg019_0586 [Fimbriimonadales bacterium]